MFCRICCTSCTTSSWACTTMIPLCTATIHGCQPNPEAVRPFFCPRNPVPNPGAVNATLEIPSVRNSCPLLVLACHDHCYLGSVIFLVVTSKSGQSLQRIDAIQSQQVCLLLPWCLWWLGLIPPPDWATNSMGIISEC